MQIKAEGEEAVGRLVATMQAGLPADSVAAMDGAEAHRQQITKWFYDCGYDMHRGLGEMYVADERFRAFYEQLAPGLAAYVRDAIAANATRHGG